MGYGSWNSSSWNNYKQSKGVTSVSTVQDIYTSRNLKDDLNPKGIKYRESCDSTDHPNSTAVIIGLDVTGSMGYLSEEIAKNSLNTLINEVYDKKPINDPHLMFMAIGDAYCDDAPLQVTQFEADVRIGKQLMDIWFESGGGGNGGESYLAAWYFAARHTQIDCYEKRKKKGFLFTIGDECNHKKLTKEQIKKFFGDDVESDMTADALLKEVSRQYEVFHLVVGNYKYHGSLEDWKETLGERAFLVTDYTKIPEIIESTMEVMDGKNVDTVAAQWDGSTSVVVKTAIGGLTNISKNNELIEF